MTEPFLKAKVDALLENLPPDGQEVLEDYLDFLADKYEIEPKKRIVALGGIWKDTPLDISDEDVRELREDASKRIVDKFDYGLSS
jgi:hypothetical protein